MHWGLQAWSWWKVVPATIWGLHWGNRLPGSSGYPSQPDGVWRPFLWIQQPHQREHFGTDPQGHIQVKTAAVCDVEHVEHCLAICSSAGKQFDMVWALGSHCADIHDRTVSSAVKCFSWNTPKCQLLLVMTWQCGWKVTVIGTNRVTYFKCKSTCDLHLDHWSGQKSTNDL